MLRPIPQQIIYKGSISNLRISAVDGTAFLDNCSTLTPYADNAHRVEIYDSAGKRLVGVLKEAGSGETLGTSTLTGADSDMSGPNHWINPGGYVLGAFDVNSTVPGKLYMLGNGGVDYTRTENVVAYTVGGLFLASAKIRLNTGTAIPISISPDIGSFNPGNITPTDVEQTYTQYFTGQTGGGVNLVIGTWTPGFNGVAYEVDDVTCKQVLTPSTDGIVIVNQKSGSTENWLANDAGFAFNRASYDVIVKKLI